MSTHSTTPPDEERLQVLLREAYEALPQPDPWRLKDIEARLSRRLADAPRRAKRAGLWPWWLAAALLAGGAAAWWAYEAARVEPAVEQAAPAGPVSGPGQRPEERRTNGGDARREGREAPEPSRADPKKTRDPLIYRRETH